MFAIQARLPIDGRDAVDDKGCQREEQAEVRPLQQGEPHVEPALDAAQPAEDSNSEVLCEHRAEGGEAPEQRRASEVAA